MQTRGFHRHWLGVACAGALLASSGCKDAGVAHYQKARDQYRALLEQSKRPSDPAFDPVIQVLRPISPLAWLPLGLVIFRQSEPAAVFTIAICAM